MIPLQRPSMTDDELRAVGEVFATGWLGMGEETTRFEAELRAFLGVREVVACNTGTSALHLALAALQAPRGAEVIVPSLTWTASVQAILMAGLTPVFADVDPVTLNLSAGAARAALSERTAAIMPVHYRGLACDLDPIVTLAEGHGAVVVEDAAHAFGSSYRGHLIGQTGHITCFSFDPIKNITCGEGGAVVTNSERFAGAMALARSMRVLGMDLDTWARRKADRQFHYDVTADGFRYHMPNICAAIGRSQLRRFDAMAARRREIASRYAEAFAENPSIRVLPCDATTTVPFMCVVLAEDRAGFMAHLKARGVSTGVHYLPNHLHTRFRAFRHTELPVTEYAANRIVTLPLFVDQTDAQVDAVIEAVRAFHGAPVTDAPGYPRDATRR